MKSAAIVLLVFCSQLAFSGAGARRDDMVCVAHAAATPGQIVDSVINLKILLVQFSDVRCRMTADGSSPRYSAVDFENLLGSEGIYVSPAMYSPDGDEVFGSMNDYFIRMSGGRMRIHAFVVNHRDSVTGKPVWVTLGQTKQYYQQTSNEAFYDSFDAADAAGLDVSLSDDTRLAVIYAGNSYFLMGGLNPMAWGFTYIMSEVQGWPYNVETPDARFSRIGIHCHEFAHTIGVGHSTGGRADLMYGGTSNGSVGGNAPAPLNAIVRSRMGWARVIPVESLSGGEADLPYSLTDPSVYVMKNSQGDMFYIENRRFDQTMTIGTTVVPDYNNVKFFPPAGPHNAISQGIFVWRVNTTGDVLDPGYSSEGLVCASGRYGRTFPENGMSDTDDGVPFPGVSNNRFLTPWSDPRNPYGKESDFFGSGGTHYNLFVPNTKGGSNCGMEVLSENRAGGTFHVKFYTSNPPNPGLTHISSLDSLGYHERSRTVVGGAPGTLHQVMELGGEILCRRSTDNGRSWTDPSRISQGNGGNSAPCIARSGQSLLVAWQMDAYDAADSGRVMLLSKSSDAGSTWSDYVSLGWSYRCGMPGAYPVLAGGKSSRAMLVYRADRASLVSESSTDAGLTWGGATSLPVGDFSWTTPSLALDDSTGEALATFSGDSPSGRGSVLCDRYHFSSGSWESPALLSGIVSREYAGFSNMSFIAGQGNAMGPHEVVWDGTDVSQGGMPVILSRKLDAPHLGNSLTVVKGASLRDLSVAGGNLQVLAEASGRSYSRVLTIMDPATSASASIEIGAARLIHRYGGVDSIRFAGALSDTVASDVEELLNSGSSARIAPGSPYDTLSVVAAIYGFRAGTLFDGGRVGFELVLQGSDTVIARFGVQSPASLQDGTRSLTLFSVPFTSLTLTGMNRAVVLRPFVEGLRHDVTLAGSLAHVYSTGREVPVSRIIAGVGTPGPVESAAKAFSLEQNYPNPFNPSTTIRFTLGRSSPVSLHVYNMLGQLVATLAGGEMPAGTHEFLFDGTRFASGTYIYSLRAGDRVATKRFVLIK